MSRKKLVWEKLSVAEGFFSTDQLAKKSPDGVV
jgi:hypothetical protein